METNKPTVQSAPDAGAIAHSATRAVAKAVATDPDATACDPSFSDSALAALERAITNYVSDLVYEAVRLSRRQRIDGVSETHVEQAQDYLTCSSQRKTASWVGTVGGIIFGAAASTLLAKDSGTAFTTATLVPIALAIAGAVMLGIHFALELRPR